MLDSNTYYMVFFHVLQYLLVNFSESFFIDASKRLDKRIKTRDQTGQKHGRKAAKNTGRLFRVFNLVEFGINHGNSTRYKNTVHH
jgi:hypothetical protein